jgi:hypothetical protein
MQQVFADGASNTLVISEQSVGCGNGGGNYNYVSIQGPYSYYYDYGGGSVSQYGILGFRTGVTFGDCGNYYYSYYMTTRASGVQIVMGDGSVRLVTQNVTPQMAYFLIDPADGNVVAVD